MIRRTKDQVLSQLPRKIRQQVFLKVDSKDLKEFNRMAEELEKTISSSDPLESLMKRSEYMNLWKRTADIKLSAMLAYLEDLLEGESKILIFAHHLNVLDNFENYFYEKKINFIRIDGSTPTSERQELCNQFQGDVRKRVALLSITAASVGISFKLFLIGLTLTSANIVIFAELYWNPGILIQAEDRAHRIGQKDCVTVYYLLARGTTDDRIWPLILQKLNTLEEIGLGKNDFGNITQIEHDPTQPTIDKFFKPTVVQ
jgi:SWI/SNF-related matrix-associated actin-dependent regulator of chromatin subfamily A-like protein 1